MEIETKKVEFEKVHIEEGVYEAVFVEARITGDKKYKDGNECQVGFLEFEVIPKEGEKPVHLSYYIPDFVATGGNKFGRALQALGADVKWGEKFDVSQLVGQQCKIWVEDYKKEVEGKEVTVSSIKDVKPLTKVETEEVKGEEEKSGSES